MSEPEYPFPAEEPVKSVLRYSVSALRTQATCSARRYFRKLAKQKLIEEDPAYPLVFGVAVHKGIEMDLKEGKDPFKVAADHVQQELLDKFDPKKLDIKTIAEKTELMNLCLRNYVKHFRTNLMESLEDPQSQVEVKLEAPWRKGVLTGVVDIFSNSYFYSDWKSGGRIPKDEQLATDPQAAVYYKLAQLCGIPPPKVFNFVYLKGKPMVKVQEKDEHGKPVFYKSGKQKGEPKMVWDTENNLKFTFPVLQDDEKIERAMRDYIVPTAVAYELDIISKNRSDINCNTCQYRTACPTITLPERTDYDALKPAAIQEAIDEQRAADEILDEEAV